jgi:sarcosine oxidase
MEKKNAMYDVIVAGIGGMGSATAYHLASRGARVLGLERFDIPHDLGSSHGVTRIIRLAYAEHPGYVPLLRRAYALWRELEDRAGERLLFITGGIDAGARESETVTGSLQSCAEHALPHEILEAAEVARRFPGYCFPETMVGVYQPDAGFLLPERCIVAHVAAAQQLGAEIHTRERVLGWEAHGNGVAVRTDRTTYTARRLVITAGPWARELAPILRPVAVPERQVLLWSQPLQSDLFTLGAFPIFNMDVDEGRFYGFPVFGVPGFKIGKYHHRNEQVDPDTMDRECHPEDESVLREAIARYFPAANGPTLAMKTCLFTNSPDEHFILDHHPEQPQVSLAAGFSGHGFKFCSVVGEIMAELALEEGSTHDIGMFRLKRFAHARSE